MWLARVQRFNFAVFSKGPPATNRGSPAERGEGTRLSVPSTFQRAPPARCRFLLGAAQRKHSPRPPRPKGKERCGFYARAPLPWQQRRKTREPICARLRAPEKSDFIGAREGGKEGVPHADKRSAVMVGEKGRKQSTIN
jgi:hypothetical protein